MKSSLRCGLISLITFIFSVSVSAPAPPMDGKLRIICFGAHPDDCELQAGGVGAMWAAKGHHVKLVSVTNGDIGHWREAGGPLARRRKRSEEHTSELQSLTNLVCRLLLEKKKKKKQ